MHSPQPSLPARDDTFFGVCQGLGEDFGFHPNWLRAGLALLLFVSPAAAAGGYVAAGMLVALSRWIAPDPRLPAPAKEVGVETADQPEAAAMAEPAPVPLAA